MDERLIGTGHFLLLHIQQLAEEHVALRCHSVAPLNLLRRINVFSPNVFL